MKRLLIDTNVLVWLLLSDRESISAPAITALTDSGNTIIVSSVSVWEISIKRSQRKLEIDEQWFDRITELDFESLAVGFIHTKKVEDLPLLHRDPFDRLLISQALTENLTVVTSDSRFRDYGVEVIW